MKIVEGKEDCFILLTTREEEHFAGWVMDRLASIGFDENSGELYSIVNRIYWAKCGYGKDLNAKVYDRLLDLVEKSNIETENSAVPESTKESWRIPEKPLFFNPDEKGRELPLVDGTGVKYTRTESIRIYQQETRTIWRNVWRSHRRIQGSYERFLVFPGDDPTEGHRKVQEDKEKRFWGEVERRKSEWGVTRKEAEKLVADYMPRGDMPPSDRSDFEPQKGLVDSMEFEIPEEDDESGFFDYHFPTTADDEELF